MYNQAKNILEMRIQTRREECIRLFERVIELDPRFTEAYVGLGRAYLSERAVSDRNKDTREEDYEFATAAAEAALALDEIRKLMEELGDMRSIPLL